MCISNSGEGINDYHNSKNNNYLLNLVFNDIHKNEKEINNIIDNTLKISTIIYDGIPNIHNFYKPVTDLIEKNEYLDLQEYYDREQYSSSCTFYGIYHFIKFYVSYPLYISKNKTSEINLTYFNIIKLKLYEYCVKKFLSKDEYKKYFNLDINIIDDKIVNALFKIYF